MAEYIEKAELIKKLCFETAEWYYSPTIKTIKDFPAADVQPVKHGKWIWDSNAPHREHGAYKCSNCGCHSDFEENYCYNCGAKMDEKE